MLNHNRWLASVWLHSVYFGLNVFWYHVSRVVFARKFLQSPKPLNLTEGATLESRDVRQCT